MIITFRLELVVQYIFTCAKRNNKTDLSGRRSLSSTAWRESEHTLSVMGCLACHWGEKSTMSHSSHYKWKCINNKIVHVKMGINHSCYLLLHKRTLLNERVYTWPSLLPTHNVILMTIPEPMTNIIFGIVLPRQSTIIYLFALLGTLFLLPSPA